MSQQAEATLKDVLWVCFGPSSNGQQFGDDLIDVADFLLRHHQSSITMLKWNDGGYLETNEYQNSNLISVHWGEYDGGFITRPLRRSEQRVIERYIKHKQDHGNT